MLDILQMNNHDWLFVAFILAALVGVSALWLADMQEKRQAVESSMTGIKAALTPFERDRQAAIDKAKQAGVDPRWVERKK